MKTILVVPAMNEEEGIRKTLEEAPEGMSVLVVGGVSTDRTDAVAASLGATVIAEPRRGYGRAYKTGIAAAAQRLGPDDVIVTADADGTYPLCTVPFWVGKMEELGIDFLTVNRLGDLAHGSMSRLHRFGNWVLSTVMRVLFWVRVRDSQSGMWLMRRSVVADLDLESFHDGMPFSEEIKVRAFQRTELRCIEVTGSYASRVGEAKLASWRDGWRNLVHLVKMRFERASAIHRRITIEEVEAYEAAEIRV